MLILESIPSKLDSLDEFIPRLLAKFKAASMDDEDIFTLQLCIEEALVNAIKHGNKLNADLSVAVTVQLDAREAVITIKDKGDGFDYGSLAAPAPMNASADPSRRGITLIKYLMDRVEYFDRGSGIRMVKALRKET